MPGYGTRASSVVRYFQGQISFLEHRFDAKGDAGTTALGCHYGLFK